MITTEQFSHPITSLPLRQQPKPVQISLKTQEKLYGLGVLAGTAVTAISQQAAFTFIPLLGLLLMQRTNQHRLSLAQQQQQQQIGLVQQSFSSLSRQIHQLETQIAQTESSPKNHLTKTHLTPIIAKLHQLHQENKAFKIKEIANLTQQINTLQQHLDGVTTQTENLQASQQKVQQQIQQFFPRTQPARPSKPARKTNKIAIFIDGANLYHSANELGFEIDYAHLLTRHAGQSSAYQAYFYTGVDSTNQHQQNFLLKLQRLGYKIISKEVIKRADGSCKANLDVELALDLVELAHTYNTAILVSGDGDFAPAIERIQGLGKRVEVVGYRATTSQKLIDLADNYFDMTPSRASLSGKRGLPNSR